MVHLNNNNGRGFTSQVMITDEKLQKKKNKQKTSLKPYQKNV